MKKIKIDAEAIQFAGALGSTLAQAQAKPQKSPVKPPKTSVVAKPLQKPPVLKPGIYSVSSTDGILAGIQSALHNEQVVQAVNDRLGTSSDKLTDKDLKALFAGK